MPSPPITLYMTTIASQPALRQRQEYIFRILQVKKIPFTTYDLASDEEAKRLWRRKAPADKQQLPGILVGGKFPGTFAEFEDAVEHDELDIFLRRKENWNPSIDEDRPPPTVKPVGIPGAASPLEMTPDCLKSKIYTTSSPSSSLLKSKIIPVNKRTNELDLGDELSGYGLQGVKVTSDELADLVAELGLDGDDAGDLVKSLTDFTTSSKAPEPLNVAQEKPQDKETKIIPIEPEVVKEVKEVKEVATEKLQKEKQKDIPVESKAIKELTQLASEKLEEKETKGIPVDPEAVEEVNKVEELKKVAQEKPQGEKTKDIFGELEVVNEVKEITQENRQEKETRDNPVKPELVKEVEEVREVKQAEEVREVETTKEVTEEEGEATKVKGGTSKTTVSGERDNQRGIPSANDRSDEDNVSGCKGTGGCVIA